MTVENPQPHCRPSTFFAAASEVADFLPLSFILSLSPRTATPHPGSEATAHLPSATASHPIPSRDPRSTCTTIFSDLRRLLQGYRFQIHVVATVHCLHCFQAPDLVFLLHCFHAP
nr:hypothetical protein Iba_chr10eCG13980 [Ipomoea batatas]